MPQSQIVFTVCGLEGMGQCRLRKQVPPLLWTEGRQTGPTLGLYYRVTRGTDRQTPPKIPDVKKGTASMMWDDRLDRIGSECLDQPPSIFGSETLFASGHRFETSRGKTRLSVEGSVDDPRPRMANMETWKHDVMTPQK